jgi:hypothetical protein
MTEARGSGNQRLCVATETIVKLCVLTRVSVSRAPSVSFAHSERWKIGGMDVVGKVECRACPGRVR